MRLIARLTRGRPGPSDEVVQLWTISLRCHARTVSAVTIVATSLEVLPAHRVALCSQPTALIVRQEQSPSTTLLLHDLVRLDQVLDHPLLVPSDPARNGQEKAPERLENERYAGIVADIRSLL